MTEEFKKAVQTYVNAQRKIKRAVDSVDRNNIEKLRMLNVWLKPIAEQRDEAKEKLLEMAKHEIASEEEIAWFDAMMSLTE